MSNVLANLRRLIVKISSFFLYDAVPENYSMKQGTRGTSRCTIVLNTPF